MDHTYSSRVRRRSVTATEAAKNFGRLVDQVREEHAIWTIERSGSAVAELGPVRRFRFSLADFKALVERLAKPGDAYLDAVEDAAERRNVPKRRRNPWVR